MIINSINNYIPVMSRRVEPGPVPGGASAGVLVRLQG